MITSTYGVLPSRETFRKQFETLLPGDTFTVEASPLHDEFSAVGGSGLDVPAGCSREYTEPELWRLVNELTAIWEDEADEQAGDDASTILYVLDFEWI